MKGCVGMDKNKSIPQFLYYSIFLIYMEACFLLFAFDKIHWLGFITCILFSISTALILSIITSMFNLKINKAITLITTGAVIFVFIAQLVYYNIYFSIISFYSIANGTSQVMEFWDKIIEVLFNMPFKILAFMLPIFITAVFGLKKINFNKSSLKSKAGLVLISIAIYFAGILTLFIPNNQLYSPKKVYYNAESPLLCSEKLGLLTAMRLDLRDQIFKSNAVKSEFDEASDTSAEINESPIDKPAEKIENNTINIDFDSLIKDEKDPVIKNIHKYFQSAEATNKNDYTGLFKGKNLILVLGESFSPMAIDKNLTPTLYKMQNEGFKFTDFYTPIWPVSTSDGEYVTCTSLVPKEGVWSMKKSSSISLPFTMGNLMKNSGYSTFCYHDHTYTYYGRNLSHPNMGYQVFKAVGNGLKINSKIWPESDVEMINASFNDYKGKKPFLTYYVTVSGHLLYNKNNCMAVKNWSYVENLNYSTAVKAYLACNIEFDRAMELLIKKLEESKLLENTVIAISADHYPYGLNINEISELKGHQAEKNFELYENTFLIWNKGMKPVTVNKAACSMDVVPTLSNLFGLNYDSRLLMGKDIMSDNEGLIIFSNRSWITDKGRYNAVTQEYKSSVNPGDQAYIDKINKIVKDKYTYSRLILDKNYYSKLALK